MPMKGSIKRSTHQLASPNQQLSELENHLADTAAKNSDATPIKKITSFTLPKKGYFDFDRFATVSLTSTSELEPRTPPLAPMQSITNSIDDSSLFIDDIQDNNNNNNNNNTSSSAAVKGIIPDLFPSTSPSNNSYIHRKRSYEIHSGSGVSGVPTSGSSGGNTLSAGIYEPHLSMGSGHSSNLSLTRRHSSTQRVQQHQQSTEPPIRKVINLIIQAQETANKEGVKRNLDLALDILKTAELYNPSTLVDNDSHTSDLVTGLMSVSDIKNFTFKIS
jgi:hypothetical protein